MLGHRTIPLGYVHRKEEAAMSVESFARIGMGVVAIIVGAVWMRSLVAELSRGKAKCGLSVGKSSSRFGESEERMCDDDPRTADMPGYVQFIIAISLCYFGVGFALREFGRKLLDYRVLAVLTFGWILPMVCHECVAIYRIIRERMTARKHRE